MWYQVFREQKAKGLTKAERAIPVEQRIIFDAEGYDELMVNYHGRNADLQGVPSPSNPCGPSTFTAYQAVMKKIYNKNSLRDISIEDITRDL